MAERVIGMSLQPNPAKKAIVLDDVLKYLWKLYKEKFRAMAIFFDSHVSNYKLRVADQLGIPAVPVRSTRGTYYPAASLYYDEYKDEWIIILRGNTYEFKEVLKQEGFHWNPEERAWIKKIPRHPKKE